MDEITNDEINVDQLLAEIDGSPTGGEIPMEATPDPVVEQPQEEIHTLNWNGREIQANKDQLTQWAQQGYDYSQKMNEFKARQQEFEKSTKQYQDALTTYQEIDRFAAENPEWWQSVMESYKNQSSQAMSQQGQTDNPLLNEISELKSQLQELSQFKQNLLQEKQEQIRMQEDKQLDETIKSVREQYSYLDWSSKDSQGYNLENQVLAYANQKGINNFEDAFKLYNHDRLISIEREKSKEQLAKNLQHQTKLGLLTQQTQKGSRPQRDPRTMSYEELTEEALAELSEGSI